jgi:hypothetical protein
MSAEVQLNKTFTSNGAKVGGEASRRSALQADDPPAPHRASPLNY